MDYSTADALRIHQKHTEQLRNSITSPTRETQTFWALEDEKCNMEIACCEHKGNENDDDD